MGPGTFAPSVRLSCRAVPKPAAPAPPGGLGAPRPGTEVSVLAARPPNVPAAVSRDAAEPAPAKCAGGGKAGRWGKSASHHGGGHKWPQNGQSAPKAAQKLRPQWGNEGVKAQRAASAFRICRNGAGNGVGWKWGGFPGARIRGEPDGCWGQGVGMSSSPLGGKILPQILPARWMGAQSTEPHPGANSGQNGQL